MTASLGSAIQRNAFAKDRFAALVTMALVYMRNAGQSLQLASMPQDL